MKEFITAAEIQEQEDREEVDLIFKIDGQEMRAYKPTEGQFALLMMAMGRYQAQTDQVAGVIDFFINVLDEPSKAYVVKRMMGRTNIIPAEQIVDILYWMIEEWGGRPTQSPSVSTSSRRNGGRKSTATLQPSTS